MAHQEKRQEFHLTDVGNATRFACDHKEDLRFCKPWGKWVCWDGKRWQVDQTNEEIRRAKITVRKMYDEAETMLDEPRLALKKFSVACESASRIKAMLLLARAQEGIPILPGDFDCNPWLFSVQNGTIDLRTGNIRSHNREDLLTKLSSVHYQANATAPVWSKFLDTIFAGNKELIVFMQRLVGYCMTGVIQDHVFPILHGSGANGKSVFVGALQYVLGQYYATVTPDLLLSRDRDNHPTELADLFGRRLVTCSETDSGRRLAESRVKYLTGNDTIKARRMREDFWEFQPSHKCWLISNHKPEIRGSDHGIWRRILLVPFNVTIPLEQQDTTLLDKLRAESPGILAWAVQGCLEWQRIGLQAPPVVRQATERYRAAEDTLGEFLRDCCITGKHYSVLLSEIYNSYNSWCQDHGEKPLNQRRFGQLLADRGYEKFKNSCVTFRGLEMSCEPDETGERGTFSRNGYQS